MEFIAAQYLGVFAGWVVVSLLGALAVWGYDAQHQHEHRPAHSHA